MDAETKKQFVRCLIQADLISRKLILTLRRGNINAEDYFTNLSRAIFELMGIPDNDDELNNKYEALTERAEFVDSQMGNDAFEPLVDQVYYFLKGYVG